MYRRLVLCLISCAFLLQSGTALSEPVLVSEATQVVHLGSQVEYLEDASGTLSIGALIDDTKPANWVSSEQDVLSFGYTSSAYWVRFDLVKSDPGAKKYLLEIAYPVLDDVRAFVYRDGDPVAQHHLGDLLPFDSRAIDHPSFLVPVSVSPGEPVRVYLRIASSSSLQIPLHLWDSNALLEHDYVAAMGNALFYGAMLIMAIYNLLIFVMVRDISYLYYLMSVVSMALLLAGIQGDSFKYLWPNAVGLNDMSLVIALSGVVFFGNFFTRSFLAIPESRPLLSKFLVTLAVLALVTAGLSFAVPYRTAMLLTMVLALSGILSNFALGILRWRDGYHAARYYNVAWTFLLTGGLILLFNKLGLMPRNWLTENAAQLGATANVVLLSFALANRMSHERKLRERAQKESALAQEELLAHQIRANQDLDRIVRQRTEELERTNIELQKMNATDGLTKLQNRRFFDDIFDKEYRRAYRDKSSIAVIMIDLDHFKRVNDSHGHQFGDLCLIEAAKVIKHCIRRPPDVAARYGGEEFVVLLPNTDLEGALCVARNVLEKLAATEITNGSISLRMTASIGVASAIPDSTTQLEGLLKAADMNLYAAKNSGRNRVEWQTPEAGLAETTE